MTMTDASAATAASGDPLSRFTIPDSVKGKFPDLIDLIARSESMNDGERQYWFDILPVMTPEQLENLRGILTNERDQLAAIDAKYAQKAGEAAGMIELEEQRRASREERRNKEEADQTKEAGHEEELLRKIQDV